MEKNEKIRKSIWLSTEALGSCYDGMKIDNSKYLNEYVEKALFYYSAYLNTKGNKDILSEVFVYVVESKLTQTETRLKIIGMHEGFIKVSCENNSVTFSIFIPVINMEIPYTVG